MPVSVDARGAAAAPRGGHRINMVTAGSMQLPALLMQICAIYLGMSAFAVSQETPESRHAASALMRTALSRAAPLVTPVEKLDRHKDQYALVQLIHLPIDSHSAANNRHGISNAACEGPI
eukprot:SAG31_NODE_335_length_17509_cov_7.127972_11_plen_120_part_00